MHSIWEASVSCYVSYFLTLSSTITIIWNISCPFRAGTSYCPFLFCQTDICISTWFLHSVLKIWVALGFHKCEVPFRNNLTMFWFLGRDVSVSEAGLDVAVNPMMLWVRWFSFLSLSFDQVNGFSYLSLLSTYLVCGCSSTPQQTW